MKKLTEKEIDLLLKIVEGFLKSREREGEHKMYTELKKIKKKLEANE
jgi:hypothetical protein